MKHLPMLLSILILSLAPCCRIVSAQVLYEGQSNYYYIRVVEAGSVRTLTFRRRGYDRNQSQVDMADLLRPCLPYYSLMFSGCLFAPEPKRILVVGLGAGVVSRLSGHYFPEAQIDSIELDPAVVDVAKTFFGFEEGGNQRVITRDARVQIKVFCKENVKYDIVMLDAFTGGTVPYHLMTKEFFQECRDILAPDGALVANLRIDWLIYQYQRRTLASVFPEQYPFGGASGSEIVVALPSERRITKGQLVEVATALQEEREFSFNVISVAKQYDMGPGFPRKGMVFSDDYVPANLLKRQLEGPFAGYARPMSAYDRMASWLRSHRIPVVSAALVLIVAYAFLRIRLARGLRRLASEEREKDSG
jgi:spermidine synthase